MVQDSPLFRHVPPELLLRREPLSDDQNALFPWREAAARLVREEELDSLAWRGEEEECDCALPNCLTCHPISDREFHDRIRQLLHDNAAALALFQAGLGRGRLQIPLSRTTFDDPQFSIIRMRSFTRLGRLKSTLARHEQQWEAACSAVVDLLAFGRLCAAGGILIQFLIGTSVQASGLSQAARLSQADPGKPVIRNLMGSLDQVVGFSELADALRGELCNWTIPTIDEVPEGSTTAQVDWLIKECYSISNQPTTHDLAQPWVDDGRLAARREQILFLLADHPQPWDAADTVDRLTEVYGPWVAYLEGLASHADAPAKPHSPPGRIRGTFFELKRNIATLFRLNPCAPWWPPVLSGGMSYEMLDNDAEAQAARDEMARLAGVSPREFAPLSHAELAKWRKKVRAVHNPIGRLLAESLQPTDCSTSLEKLHEQVAATRESLEHAMSA